MENDTLRDTPKKNEMKTVLSLPLSDAETYLIGSIVAHWGALEYQIFEQTFMTFDDDETELPKAMDNISFTSVFSLWKERVVAKAGDDVRAVLEKQAKGIDSLLDYRNALVHGMWQWDINQPDHITSFRIKKRQMISTHFTKDDLHEFSMRLGEINYNIRYPRGTEDRAKEISEIGGYISRHAAEEMFGIGKGKDSKTS